MRQDLPFFGDVELELVYIAKKLKEALALEDILTAAGIEYLVEPDTYKGGFIFMSERIGAFFYVAPDRAKEVRGILEANRYKPFQPQRA